MCHSDVPAGQTEVQVERRNVRIPVSGGEMPATLTGGGDDMPGVLVLSDMFGPTPFYEHLSGLLSAAGFRALLPDFFFREGPVELGDVEAAFGRRQRLDESQTLDDLSQALQWMGGSTAKPEMGLLGFCMGGTFALDMASMQHGLTTVVYYAFPTINEGLQLPPPPPMDLVDTLSGPVLAFWGDQDHFVGMDNVDAYADRATRANPDFAYEVLPGLGHAFLGDGDLADPEDPAGGTWDRTLRHFRSHLSGGA
jgi:carboxymethylenebutenolidase